MHPGPGSRQPDFVSRRAVDSDSRHCTDHRRSGDAERLLFRWRGSPTRLPQCDILHLLEVHRKTGPMKRKTGRFICLTRRFAKDRIARRFACRAGCHCSCRSPACFGQGDGRQHVPATRRRRARPARLPPFPGQTPAVGWSQVTKGNRQSCCVLRLVPVPPWPSMGCRWPLLS